MKKFFDFAFFWFFVIFPIIITIISIIGVFFLSFKTYIALILSFSLLSLLFLLIALIIPIPQLRYKKPAPKISLDDLANQINSIRDKKTLSGEDLMIILNCLENNSPLPFKEADPFNTEPQETFTTNETNTKQ